MAKNKEQLTKEAQALGLNTESLDTNAKLKDAIKAKTAELAHAELVETATAFGLDVENKTTEELLTAIEAHEAKLKEEADAAKAAPEPVLNATQLRQQKAKELRAEKAKAAEKKASKQAAIAEESAAPTSDKEEKDNRKVFTDERGLKFRFKKSAPKSLNIDGASTPTSKLIEDEEVMLELVNGNSNFIEQIY